MILIVHTLLRTGRIFPELRWGSKKSFSASTELNQPFSSTEGPTQSGVGNESE